MDPFCRDFFDPDDLYFQSTTYGGEQLVLFTLCGGRKNASGLWEKIQSLIACDYGRVIRPFTIIGRLQREDTLAARLKALQLDSASLLPVLTRMSKMRSNWTWRDFISHFDRSDLSFIAIYTELPTSKATLASYVLRGLRYQFPQENVPRETPTDPDEYDRLEQLFVSLCRRRRQACWEMDRAMWQRYRACKPANNRACRVV